MIESNGENFEDFLFGGHSRFYLRDDEENYTPIDGEITSFSFKPRNPDLEDANAESFDLKCENFEATVTFFFGRSHTEGNFDEDGNPDGTFSHIFVPEFEEDKILNEEILE